MPEHGIPISLIPAVFGLVGLLWLLFRKPGSGGRPKPTRYSQDDRLGPPLKDTSEIERKNQDVEKEDATLSQQKIPEPQARFDDSSRIHNPRLDELTATEDNQESIVPDKHTIVCNSSVVEQSFVQRSSAQCNQGKNVGFSQIAYVENLVFAVIKEGLRAAHIKLCEECSFLELSDQKPAHPESTSQFSSVEDSGSQTLGSADPHKITTGQLELSSLTTDHTQAVGSIDPHKTTTGQLELSSLTTDQTNAVSHTTPDQLQASSLPPNYTHSWTSEATTSADVAHEAPALKISGDVTNEIAQDSASADSSHSDNSQATDDASKAVSGAPKKVTFAIDPSPLNESSSQAEPSAPAKRKSSAKRKKRKSTADSSADEESHDHRADSENVVTPPPPKILVGFNFNVPTELCGRLVGKCGKKVKRITKKTGVEVDLVTNFDTREYQVCRLVGSKPEVKKALALIRQWFPKKHYPHFTMDPVDMYVPVVIQLEPVLSLEVMQLSLPKGASVDVFVSAVVDAGHVFVQQPTHPSFIYLEKLNDLLSFDCLDPHIPRIPTPVESGVICVCEDNGFWYRALVTTAEDKNGEVQVKFVDYGGYAVKSVESLKRVRTDITFIPFQAVECYLANIVPNKSEQLFSDAATEALMQMTDGKLLRCQVVTQVDDESPTIHLYQIDRVSKSAVMINQILADRQLVQWV